MNRPPRAKKATESFVHQPPVIGTIQMRPMTGGSMDLCRELELSFVDCFEALKDVPEAEAQRQTFTFLFIHGYRNPDNGGDAEKDVAEMEKILLGDEETFAAELRKFAKNIPMEEVLPKILEWWLGVNARTTAALFKVVSKYQPEPGSKGSSPPPNA